MYNIVFSPEAIRDLEETKAYITEELCNEQVAAKTVSKILKEIRIPRKRTVAFVNSWFWYKLQILSMWKLCCFLSFRWKRSWNCTNSLRTQKLYANPIWRIIGIINSYSNNKTANCEVLLLLFLYSKEIVKFKKSY